MSKKTTKELLEHAQKYVRATMADFLRAEGFVSKGNEDIYWYRIVNGDVVQSIYFYTQEPHLPMVLEIGYGCHPLFITPIFSGGPLLRNRPGNEVLYPRYILMSMDGNRIYSKDVLVECPGDEMFGIKLLNEIMRVFRTTTTPYACYEMHKLWRDREIQNGMCIDVTTHFVDEVIFWNDREMYPFCEKYTIEREKLLKYGFRNKSMPQKYAEELEYLDILKFAFMDEGRNTHIMMLNERAKQTARLLERHTGIRV